MAVAITRRRFSVDDYHRMAEARILSGCERVELIDGEILVRSPIGPPHCAGVDRATRAMVMAAGDRAIVRVQGSVQLDRFYEPQPDLVLLRLRKDFYASRHPGPQDVLLVVEIADSSIAYDRDVKAPMYAELGVPEYWLADLTRDVLTVHSEPGGGAYRNCSVHRRGETIAPGLLPEAAVPVDGFLPDRE